MNQTKKNVRSTKQKATPLEKSDTTTLKGKKVRNIYTNVYEVHNKFFRSNGKITNNIKKGKQIHYGHGGD